MIDMLRDMIHDLRARVAALEAQLSPQKQPNASGAMDLSDDGGAGGTIQPDDPTNEDDNG